MDLDMDTADVAVSGARPSEAIAIVIDLDCAPNYRYGALASDRNGDTWVEMSRAQLACLHEQIGEMLERDSD